MSAKGRERCRLAGADPAGDRDRERAAHAESELVRVGLLGSDFIEADLRDPDINVRYGTWLLDYLRDRYDGDVAAALAAYHAGPGNVDEWRRDGSGIEFPKTRAYVDEVERVRRIYARAYGRDLGL